MELAKPSPRKADFAVLALVANHPEVYQEARLKAELLAVCKDLCEEPAYALDILAEESGHQIWA